MIYNYTEKSISKLIATRTRSTDISAYELSKSHIDGGEYLGRQIIDNYEMVPVEINHVQGKKKGYELESKNVVIVSLMRAGLFTALGMRKVFQDSELLLSNSIDDLDIHNISNKDIYLVDSVVNTGRTIHKYINYLKDLNPNKISVVTLVTNSNCDMLKNTDIDLYTLRVSQNSYVGKGNIDTGNRLFKGKGGFYG